MLNDIVVKKTGRNGYTAYAHVTGSDGREWTLMDTAITPESAVSFVHRRSQDESCWDERGQLSICDGPDESSKFFVIIKRSDIRTPFNAQFDKLEQAKDYVQSFQNTYSVEWVEIYLASDEGLALLQRIFPEPEPLEPTSSWYTPVEERYVLRDEMFRVGPSDGPAENCNCDECRSYYERNGRTL